MNTPAFTPTHKVSGSSKEATTGESVYVTRVDAIAESIKAAIKPTQEPVQHELARLARILRYLYDGPDLASIACAEIIAKALLQEEPHMVLAKEALDALETHYPRSPFAAMVRARSAPARVILGLGSFLYFGLPLGYFLFRRISAVKEILGVNVSMLIGVALAGALGSIVSIMVRLQDFVSVNVKDPTVIFFTGFFKPIVGMSFAMFVFATINAGILPLAIKVDTPAAGYFFLALGFISGFSERFAQDVASRAEKSIK
jgi:hypothetical protein